MHGLVHVYVHVETRGGGFEGKEALLGEPYRRFLGERVEASLGFGSTTRTAWGLHWGEGGGAGGIAG